MSQAASSGAPVTAVSGAQHVPPRQRLRWRSGLIVLLAGLLGISLVSDFAPDWMRRFLLCFVAVPATGLALLVWWLFFCGLTVRARLIGLAAAAGALALLCGLVRFDGLEGDMHPRWAFRWQQPAEQRAEEFFARATDKAASAASAHSAWTITPADWPEFRGHGRQGIVRAGSIRRDWAAVPPKLVWKHPVGPGWSSLVIVGDFVFTQEQRGGEEVVVCYHAETGGQVWVHADTVRFEEWQGGPGPRATPTLAGGRLFSLGATGILNCLDPATGKRHWTRNILDDAAASNLEWGMCASPLVFEQLVIVNPGGGNGKSVIAYDADRGDIRWAAGSRTAGYAAPRVELLGDVPQVLVFGGDGLAGHDPRSGKELWFREWTNSPRVNAAQPLALDGGRLFFSSGYGVGGMLLEVARDDGGWVTKDLWPQSSRDLKLKFNDGVSFNGHIYGLDEGILACIDSATGKRVWKRGRYGYGQLLLIEDLLVILAENGDLALVQATPTEFNELARVPALQGTTWNHPAFARGRLYVRNGREAACFDVSP